jgi:hypothetical protein
MRHFWNPTGGGLVDEFDVDAALQPALDRLALLAEVTTALGSTLDADEALRRAKQNRCGSRGSRAR